ncbi:MAG: hypothetical protein JSR82_06295 [Verrucomicrobia bacterium]|nr:hypothetical protein [Verrucomicrobiota bacterium]
MLVCAEGAGSRIACPRDCPHFPFAEQRYDEVGEIVTRAKEQLEERFGSTVARREFINFIINGEPKLQDWEQYLQMLLRERDAAGLTFFEAWEREGWLGVRNDRRLVLRSLAGLRLRLLLVERIQDDTILFVRDLLAPADSPLLEMRDRTLCRTAGQYGALLAPLGPLAHYHMGWWFARPIPRLPSTGPRALALQLAHHLGFEGDDTHLSEWLETNLGRFDLALTELANLYARPEEDEDSPAQEISDLLPADLVAEARRLRELGGWEALAGPSAGQQAPDPEAWLDAPNVWLGTTPRAAAADPARAHEVRTLLQGLLAFADQLRVERQAFPDWTPVAAELGWPDLRHTLPSGWVPPRAGEHRDDARMRASWPAALQQSSEAEPPGVVLSGEDLTARAQAKRGKREPDAVAVSQAYADAIAFLLVETEDWGDESDAPKIVLQALLETCFGAWGLETPRYGIIPGRVRQRRDVIEARMVEFASAPDARQSGLRAFTQHCRQPALADVAIALLLRPPGGAEEHPEASPTDLVSLLPVLIALLDELDACIAAWAADHPSAIPR